jgi:hypothetical protein
VAFNESRDDLMLNTAIKGIALDSMEETTEEIVPSHNTTHDGTYYKLSEIPEEPTDSFNGKQQARRQER